MQDKKTFLNLRVSDQLKKRINQVFEKEGIDWTSLVKARIFEFVCQVEAGENPKLEKEDRLIIDSHPKNKQLQVQLSPILKERLARATEKMNVTATNVVLPYLIRLMLQAEARQKGQEKLESNHSSEISM